MMTRGLFSIILSAQRPSESSDEEEVLLDSFLLAFRPGQPLASNGACARIFRTAPTICSMSLRFANKTLW